MDWPNRIFKRNFFKMAICLNTFAKVNHFRMRKLYQLPNHYFVLFSWSKQSLVITWHLKLLPQTNGLQCFCCVLLFTSNIKYCDTSFQMNRRKYERKEFIKDFFFVKIYQIHAVMINYSGSYGGANQNWIILLSRLQSLHSSKIHKGTIR